MLTISKRKDHYSGVAAFFFESMSTNSTMSTNSSQEVIHTHRVPILGCQYSFRISEEIDLEPFLEILRYVDKPTLGLSDNTERRIYLKACVRLLQRSSAKPSARYLKPPEKTRSALHLANADIWAEVATHLDPVSRTCLLLSSKGLYDTLPRRYTLAKY